MDDTKPKRHVLIAGETNTGKSAFLAAVERAALQNRDGEARLKFSPTLADDASSDDDLDFIGQATDNYLSRAAEYFLKGIPFQATGGPQSYDFRLGVQKERGDRGQFQFIDAPGEYFSPRDRHAISEDRARILKQARKDGYDLVFCFEALPEFDPGFHLMTLEQNLSRLLSSLSSRTGHMNSKRVLFLLTKIDIPATVFCDRMSQDRSAFPLNPHQLATRLDPLEQMRSIVGSENIAKFVNPNSTTCEFAVGICSAFGFDRTTGRPMVSPYTHLPLRPPGRTPEEHYRAWTPFGVREALLFLTLGEGSACVKKIQPENADFEEQRGSTCIPYRSRA